MKELKRATTFDEQIAKFNNRKLIMNDSALVEKVLSDIGYYRFSGYTYLFYKKNAEIFRQGVSIEEIYAAYEMDEEYRALLLKYLSKIEVRLKSSISNRLGLLLGSGFYLKYDPQIFTNQENHESFLEILKSEKRKSKAPFVVHHNKEYGGNLPIWAAMEILSFGDVSKMYRNLKKQCQQAIEQDFNGINYVLLASWFQGLSIVRNMCAHNNRLYKVTVSYTYNNNHKNGTDRAYAFKEKKLFTAFQVIGILMRGDEDREKFVSEIKAIANKYSTYKSLSLKNAYGFTADWEDILMKQK